MSDMPERIWAWQNYRRFWADRAGHRYPSAHHVEYIRVDAVVEKLKEIQASTPPWVVMASEVDALIRELEGSSDE